MDVDLLRSRSGSVLGDAVFEGMPGLYQGKVRDLYDLGDGRLAIVASDRLSAFDKVLAVIPFKGQVLTGIARWAFEQTADLCDNHVLSYPDPNVVVGQKLAILPVEMVVRGYLAGTTSTSVLTLYKAGRREMYGTRLPERLRDNQALPEPIITPTSKAFDGGHDEPLSAKEILDQGLLTQAQWDEVSAKALAVFARGQALAAERGLILADTKYEFGTDEAGSILLADEIHTPDSSRYWRAATYRARFEAGARPDSFDKDVVRAWVAARCDPYKDEIPKIPDDLIFQTALTYVEAFERITGETFEPPAAGEDVRERVRRAVTAL